MTKTEDTQQIENEKPKNKKELFMERFLQNYPDISAEDEEAFYGKIGDEFDRFDRSDKAQRELGELLSKDPRSAGFLMVLRKGGNPMEYLIEQYGDDFRDALNDEEKAKELTAAFAKYAERETRNAELQSKAESNMQTMLDELDAAQAEGNFTDDDVTNAYEYLYADGGLLDRIITNEIHKEDWLMLMKAAKYDTMIAQARTEGEVAGRNANIDTQKRKMSKAKNMPGNIPSASGETKSINRDGMLEMLDKRRKSVWED